MHDGGSGTILVRRAVAAGRIGNAVAARHHPRHSNTHRAGCPDSVRPAAVGSPALLAAGVGAPALDHFPEIPPRSHLAAKTGAVRRSTRSTAADHLDH